MIPFSLLPGTMCELVPSRTVLHTCIRLHSRAWINSGTSQLVFTPLFKFPFKAFVIPFCLILSWIIFAIEHVVSLLINRHSNGVYKIALALSLRQATGQQGSSSTRDGGNWPYAHYGHLTVGGKYSPVPLSGSLIGLQRNHITP
jgi:hypothetical protein